MINSIHNKINQATKWSAITEILAKLVAPISSIVLARLLSPEVYGIVVSINLVISFTDLFTDAGFQKYIIQYDFKNENDLDKATNIAFWTNLCISVFLWIIIVIFSKEISNFVGCEGKELALIIASMNLPILSFSSIQMARYKRDLIFKTLFNIRMISISIPFLVTIPLAFITRSHWSLIFGTLITNFINAILLTVKSDWKPSKFYDFQVLKRMFKFSIWSMSESILVWITNWGDTLIVTSILSSYYLGLYKTSMNIVNQIIGVVSAATTPVLLSSLSRLQNNREEFSRLYYRFSIMTSILIIPMGVGIFIYQDFICNVLLGNSWIESSEFIGIWGLISSIAILLNSYNGNVLIAMGRPKISVIIQIIQIIFIIPATYISANISYTSLIYTRSLIRIVGMILFVFVVWKLYDLSFFKLIKKIKPVFFATTIMAFFAYMFVSMELNIALVFYSIAICIIIYFLVLLMFPSMRNLLYPIIYPLLKKVKIIKIDKLI